MPGFPTSSLTVLTGPTGPQGSSLFVSAAAFGAVDDGVTDNSTAIANAIAALPAGGIVFFPAGPTGIYGVASQINLPTNKAIVLMGAGRAAVSLKALASMTAVVSRSTGFFRGGGIRDLTIDANAIASYAINLQQADVMVFERLFALNATVTNILVGNGAANTQENIFSDIRTDNPLLSGSSLPAYNLDIAANAVNNDFRQIKLANALTANLRTAGANNKFFGVHGYNFPTSTLPTNQFLVNGTGEQFVEWECDGSGTANIQVNGFLNMFAGGFSQFQGISAAIGLQIANTITATVVVGNNFKDSTAGNCVVQAGTAGSSRNTVWGNQGASFAMLASNLPTSDPHVVGQVWLNSGVVTVSAG